MITWSQLEPALPPVGQAACVRAADFAEGFVKMCLAEPRHVLLPERELHEPVPPAKVLVESDAEWLRSCHGAAARGLMTFLRKDEVMHVGGQPVLNGMFGGGKER